MRFGLFGSAQANGSDLGAGIGQGFYDYIDFNVEAESLGYHSTFLVEHHFTGWSQVSATLSLLTYLAARTKTLRLGTAVMVLPWHNPVLLAEQAATLDVLSGGRLDFGIGKGYRHSEFTGFCILGEEAEERFEEGLEVILKAWTSEGRFSHHGRFWNFENIVVEPAAVQRPRPAIWMAAGSEPSIHKVATRGFNLLLDQFAGPDLIWQRIDFFRSELDKEDAIERLNAMRQRTIDVAKAPNQSGGSHILAYARSGAPDVSSTLIGTTEEIYHKLVALNEAGAEYIILSVLAARATPCGSSPTRSFPNSTATAPAVVRSGCRSCNEGQAP